MGRSDDVAAALGHFLTIRIEDPPADDDVVPGHRFLMQIGFNDCIKRPGADDLVALWTNVHGKKFAVTFRVIGPMTCNLWGQRTRGPGIHDVRIADKAVRLASCRLVK